MTNPDLGKNFSATENALSPALSNGLLFLFTLFILLLVLPLGEHLHSGHELLSTLSSSQSTCFSSAATINVSFSTCFTQARVPCRLAADKHCLQLH